MASQMAGPLATLHRQPAYKKGNSVNQTEYKAWEEDARRALSGRYCLADIGTVLDWFRSIKGADERDLIGNDEVEAMLTFTGARDNHDLYNSLMARLFIYAPLILAQTLIDDERKSDRRRL